MNTLIKVLNLFLVFGTAYLFIVGRVDLNMVALAGIHNVLWLILFEIEPIIEKVKR